ncbi:MAG: isopeptide-forming domain-containing fimbrial protein [Bifidobacterium sp.]|nr:isopeptide-forming domain-containing fimbrial protein [Bifidobacterium sp.]
MMAKVASQWLGFPSSAGSSTDVTSNASGGGWQGKLRDFVTVLAARTDIKADIASSGYAVTAGSSATSVTLTGLPIGLYLVVDTTGAGSTTAVAGTNAPASIPILAGTVLMSTAPQTYSKFKDDTAMTLGTVTVKNNVPTIKKKLVAPNYGSASIGDELTYQLIGSVPLTTGFSHYTYKLTDLPHSGLTYVPGSVSIRIANSEYAPDASALKTLTEGAVGAVGTDYAVTVTPGDGGQVAFNLSPGIVAIGHQYYGKLIRVEYKMKVNDTATTSADMINGFKLSYSNDTGNPPAADNGDDTNTDGTVTTITDTNPGDPVALHFYHFQMEVQAKIDSTTKLSGATFQILDPVFGDPMLFKKLADGSYKKVGIAGNTVGVNDVVDTLTSATGGLGGTYHRPDQGRWFGLEYLHGQGDNGVYRLWSAVRLDVHCDDQRQWYKQPYSAEVLQLG